MQRLFIDTETFSDIPIRGHSVQKYMDANGGLHLIAYRLEQRDGTLVSAGVVDITGGETLPKDIGNALVDEDVLKIAHNAEFDWYVLYYNGFKTDIDQWYDTSAAALSFGYPGDLMSLSIVLKVSGKLSDGKRLIRKFCGKKEQDHTDPDWQLFKDYCEQDVQVLSEVYAKMPKMLSSEYDVWKANAIINSTGIAVNESKAQKIADRYKEIKEQMSSKINLASQKQILDYCKDKGIELPNVTADTVKQYISKLTESGENPLVLNILKQRQEVSQTSLKKVETLLDNAVDGRIHSMFKYMGANATGRWSSKLVQLQNLPRPSTDIKLANDALDNGNANTEQLKTLIRSCITASPGKMLLAIDYSQIEAIVGAWLADDQTIIDAYTNKKDLHKLTASRMYGVSEDAVTKEQRQAAKTIGFASQYGAGIAGVTKADSLNVLTETQIRDGLNRWKKANQKIIDLGMQLEKGVLAAMQSLNTPVKLKHGVAITANKSKDGTRINVAIILPSGRPTVMHGVEKDAQGNLTYTQWENGHETKKKCYSSILFNYLTQGTSRDVLANALLSVHRAGISIVGHVHDELIMDVREEDVPKALDAFSAKPEWLEGLCLRAEATLRKEYGK